MSLSLLLRLAIVLPSLNAAVRSVFLHLTEAMAWPTDRLIVMGRSLGSGPAARIAREFQPGVRAGGGHAHLAPNKKTLRF